VVVISAVKAGGVTMTELDTFVFVDFFVGDSVVHVFVVVSVFVFAVAITNDVRRISRISSISVRRRGRPSSSSSS